MRVYFICLSILFIFFPTASFATEFYPWDCTYDLLEGGWHSRWASTNENRTKMDWNQTAAHSKAIMTGAQSGEYGACSYVASIGYDLSLNVLFIKGENLQPVGNACEYSGKNVEFIHTRKEIKRSDEFTYARQKVSLDGVEFETLKIVGISPQPVKPGEMWPICDTALEKITGQKPVKSKTEFGFGRTEVHAPGFLVFFAE